MAADESHDDNTRTHVVQTKGTMVSHYRINEKIGVGGMGEVFLAEDSKLSRNVALKFLSSHLCHRARKVPVARLRQEGINASR